VQEQFPGFRFRLAGAVDGHHDQARFGWEFGPAGGDAPSSRGGAPAHSSVIGRAIAVGTATATSAAQSAHPSRWRSASASLAPVSAPLTNATTVCSSRQPITRDKRDDSLG